MKNGGLENRVDEGSKENKDFKKKPFEKILGTQNLLLFMALNNVKKEK